MTGRLLRLFLLRYAPRRILPILSLVELAWLARRAYRAASAPSDRRPSGPVSEREPDPSPND